MILIQCFHESDGRICTTESTSSIVPVPLCGIYPHLTRRQKQTSWLVERVLPLRKRTFESSSLHSYFLCRVLMENILRSRWRDYDSRSHDPKHHVYVSNLRYEFRFIQIPGHSKSYQPPHHRITAEREDLIPVSVLPHHPAIWIKGTHRLFCSCSRKK
jgi:hypothetical protein